MGTTAPAATAGQPAGPSPAGDRSAAATPAERSLAEALPARSLASAVERRRQDRRKRRFSFVLHERRSGFDRRAPGPDVGRAAVFYRQLLLGLRDRPRLLALLLLLVNVLNLADFSLTLNVLGRGGQEANPILRPLFAADPLYAAGFKGVAVLLTTWVVWRCRRFRSGLEAVLIMLTVFSIVLLYHIFGLLAFS